MWVMAPQDRDGLDEAIDLALTPAHLQPLYALSQAERIALHAVYDLYDALLGQPHPEMMPIALEAARPFMRAAYDQVQIGGRLATLRQRLLASTDQCPYCGFGEPRDLDHYLPRVDYGELAIYPRNLIPSCSPCNNAKRTVVPGQAGNPGLIHAYFQALPDLDFLTADISFDEGALDVRYRIEPAGLDPILAAKLQFQLDRLKLNARYKGQINIFLSGQRTAMLMFKDLGADLFADFLHRSADNLALSHGRNDWRVALVRALSSNAEFCAAPELYCGPQLPPGAP